MKSRSSLLISTFIGIALDPKMSQRRRTKEARRRNHRRQIFAIRRAQKNKILSQHEQAQPQLYYCTACIEKGYDKATCRGSIATGHNRDFF